LSCGEHIALLGQGKEGEVTEAGRKLTLVEILSVAKIARTRANFFDETISNARVI
jgi:hypothetical protein